MSNNDKHIPSKRVRNWHRGSGVIGSLKSYAEGLVMHGTDAHRATIKQWLANKAASK